MGKRKKKKAPSRSRDEGLVAHYMCQGCGRSWKEDLALISTMRTNGQLDPLHSGTYCTCGHPYIQWTNYDELAPKLRRRSEP